jgi:hypothetical protein
MSQLRIWRFVLSFAVLYGLLILPWPGLRYAVGTYVQAFGTFLFGQSGREFMNGLDHNTTGQVTTTVHHMVLFRPRGPADKSYSDATDTIVVLFNFDVVDPSKRGGAKIGLESKNDFWLPFSFYLALVGATPMPWRRRVWAIVWGFLAANFLLALTLTVYLAHYASDISMIVLSPFWKSAVGRLTNLLLVVSGPSILVYLFIWPLACFRREELARLIPGWRVSTPSPPASQVPARQNRKAQPKAAHRKKVKS